MRFDQNIKNNQLPRITCKSLWHLLAKTWAGFPSFPALICPFDNLIQNVHDKLPASGHKFMAMSSQGTDVFKKCYNLSHCTAPSY